MRDIKKVKSDLKLKNNATQSLENSSEQTDLAAGPTGGAHIPLE